MSSNVRARVLLIRVQGGAEKREIETFLAPRLHLTFSTPEPHHTVKRLFGDRIISRNANIAWPPRSPDLSERCVPD
jgi:hypothetical protein